MELELISASRLKAEAKTADGKIVRFGYKKSPHILIDLVGKPAGTKFNADVAVSDRGNLYNENTIDVEEAYFRAETMNKKRQIMDKQLAKFDE